MRKHLQYIFLALATVVLAVSCVKELEFEQPMGEGDALTLVPRVRSFANHYVTKATPYDGDKGEKNITRLAVFVFNSNGNLIHWYEDTSGSDVVTLNKSMLNSPAQSSMLDNATVVLIANVDLDDVKKGTVSIKDNSDLTIDDLENYTINTSGTVFTEADLKAEDFSGLPMIGGIKVDLTHAAGSQDVEVGMKILYAKIKFNLSVAAGTENQGSGMKFDLTGYSVHNTSTATTLAIPANMGEKPVDFLGNEKADAVQATVDVATASNVYQTNAKDVENAASTSTSTDGIEFTFYIPESRYNHNLEIGDLQTVYPTDWCTNEPSQDVKNYQTGQRLNKVKYFYDDLTQQFKPKIAEKTGSTKAPQPGAGLATYVLLKGSYTDYKGDIWDLKYKVYLGKDNDQNFHVDRNSIYTNNITIKGIRNNDSYGTDQVWVDHRVTVENASGAADCVTITRETLIDSHIEVRPLRVSWPEGKYDGVRIYLPTNADGSLVDWIGIERFTGENCQDNKVYCYNTTGSTGKRKYFTTTLISELQNKEGGTGVITDGNRKYIALDNDDCAWIYFDENSSPNERPAEIELEFYSTGSDPVIEKYEVVQCGIHPVRISDNLTYNIESYEEYLHTYDSADKFHLSTSPADYTQQGLSWGQSRTISEDHIVSTTTSGTLLEGMTQRYDYFHNSDIPNSNYYRYSKSNGSWQNIGFDNETGIDFTDRASANQLIKIQDMGSIPESAYQYCLSKNKFKEDAEGKHTLDIHWYLPDVYEMQAVLNSGDFAADVYYWSSQPSYDIILGTVDEVASQARAVSKAEIRDIGRNKQNRIRCFYSADGITADMSERAPDGIGGNYTFIMKAEPAKGYFNYKLSSATIDDPYTTVAQDYQYKDSDYPFPKFGPPVSQNFFGYFSDIKDKNGNSVEGFAVNPLDMSLWQPYQGRPYVGADYRTYYLALKDYPGLSDEVLEYDTNEPGNGGAYPNGTDRSDTKIYTTTTLRHYSLNLYNASQNNQLEELDHTENGDMFKITFGENTKSISPQFEYSEYINNSEERTEVRKWQLPTYPTATYVPERGSNTEPFEGKATSTATRTNTGGIWGFGGTWDKTESQTIEEAQTKAKEAAYNNALKAAQQKYPGRECVEVDGTNTITIIDEEWTDRVGSSHIYQAIASGTVTFTCTATTDPPTVTYYTDAVGGGWKVDENASTSKNLDGIQFDELRIYYGNTLTIELTAPYKKKYEIRKVKIHCSGNTEYEVPDGNFDTYYARFVESGITLPQESKEVPSWGAEDPLQIPGMEYNIDVENGEGWHQWSGNNPQSVTFKLVDYITYTNKESGLNLNFVSKYKYDDASIDLTKYIVIDKIEVQCTPISTE